MVKGHENFENMRVMVDNLTSIIGGNNAVQTGTKLKEEIAAAEDFHKVNFTRHLEYGLSKCMCLKCRFTHPIDDPIQCSKQHNPPCKDCQDAFNVSSLSIHFASFHSLYP